MLTPRYSVITRRNIVRTESGFVSGSEIALFSGTNPFKTPIVQNPRGPRSIPFAETKGWREIITTAFVGQVPVYDWPNPKAKPRAPQAVTQSTPLVMKGSDAFFGLGGPSYSWPNPRAVANPLAPKMSASRIQTELRQFEPRFGLTIKHKWPVTQQPGPPPNVVLKFSGVDVQFGAAGQTKSYDWPNPRIKPQPVLSWVLGNKYLTIDQPIVVHKQRDWPLPTPVARLAPAQTKMQRQLFESYPDPLKSRSGTRIQHRWPVAQQPLQLNNLAVKQSFPQSPIRMATMLPPVRRIETFYAQDAIINESIYEEKPFNQLDWPNPTLKVKINPHFVRGNLVLTTVAPPPKPFAALNWPNPLPVQPIRSSQIDFMDLCRIGADAFFGGPGQAVIYDWPNPQAKPRAQALSQWTQSTDIGLIGKDKFFGAIGQGPRYDWPNPKGKRPIPQQGIQQAQAVFLAESLKYYRGWATMIGA